MRAGQAPARPHPGQRPTVDEAGEPESSHWEIDGEVRLRGRAEPTRLAFPADLAEGQPLDEQVTAA